VVRNRGSSLPNPELHIRWIEKQCERPTSPQTDAAFFGFIIIIISSSFFLGSGAALLEQAASTTVSVAGSHRNDCHFFDRSRIATVDLPRAARTSLRTRKA
jgi:hypothetical protein